MNNLNEEKYLKKVQILIEEVEVNTKVREIQDNSEKLRSYWKIGKLIVEAQGGKSRAKYGDNLIRKWSNILTAQYGKFYGYTNLKYMRLFYNNFPIGHAVRDQLTWTHYKMILPIKNENERNYYINQVILNNLSSRELRQEIKNKSFARLSYADKENIKLIDNNNYNLTIEDMIKDPIIIETKENIDNLSEKVLHKLIINMLEDKFLELGTGFTIAGHEYKITIDNKVYKIDLLFFNVKLNSYIVVEVKTKEFKPKDIGQINLYVNYIDNNIKELNNNKTIGILLVKKKNKLVIEYTTNDFVKDIFITTYKLINRI